MKQKSIILYWVIAGLFILMIWNAIVIISLSDKLIDGEICSASAETRVMVGICIYPALAVATVIFEFIHRKRI